MTELQQKRMNIVTNNIKIFEDFLKENPNNHIAKQLLYISNNLKDTFLYENNNNLKSVCDMTNKEAEENGRIKQWNNYIRFFIVLMAYTTTNGMWNHIKEEMKYLGYDNDDSIIPASFFKEYYQNHKDMSKEEIEKEFKNKKGKNKN